MRLEESDVRIPLRWVGRGLLAFCVVLAVLALLGLVVMGLWNALVPQLFRGPTLQYGQALGLLILSRLLFGGLRARGGWRGHWRQRMWREQWEQMTPEERARLRDRMQSRCGRGSGSAEASATPPP
jgi:hypothetical protein